MMNSDKDENLTIEEIDPRANELADLPVAGDQAKHTTGGSRSSGIQDTNGHGTHVAGTVGGSQ
jgi:subtilisin family serine protease